MSAITKAVYSEAAEPFRIETAPNNLAGRFANRYRYLGSSGYKGGATREVDEQQKYVWTAVAITALD
jgi:hypothetical protein